LFADGTFRRFKKTDGLSSDFVECLHFADDGALWIGTFGGGLDRFKDGKFSAITASRVCPTASSATSNQTGGDISG